MNRLYKSNTDKVFDGVCGGLGEYFSLDPVIVRLLWVVLVIFGGTGVLAYLVAMIIIPKNPDSKPLKTSSGLNVEPAVISQQFWGMLLVLAGALLLIGFIGPLGGIFASAAILMSSVLWPFLIIGLGLYLFFSHSGNEDVSSTMHTVFPKDKKLHRSRYDKKIAGVCGGVGSYFNVDSNIIRIFWTMATLGSFGFGILAYVILAIFLAEAE